MKKYHPRWVMQLVVVLFKLLHSPKLTGLLGWRVGDPVGFPRLKSRTIVQPNSNETRPLISRPR